ncbi:UDP-2,3-diacylglucosamine hydrolase [Salmonella enterica subsp. enterica]|uniref:UDP-2,3-diacylglucosamine hydrolase n=1 Tax=Salmonella enterica I TaxID=59201 RepID=A0A3S4INB5_SALET|nr:UDP-2,3-diacylglucosamine hydrolase [Salmonella enterica subsp. enterica]
MMPDIRRFAPKSIIRGCNDCSLPCPLFIRRRIAARMRAGSKAANSSKSLDIMDVNAQTVVAEMEKHRVQWLIHGHTHRPAVHELSANDQPAFPRGVRRMAS